MGVKARCIFAYRNMRHFVSTYKLRGGGAEEERKKNVVTQTAMGSVNTFFSNIKWIVSFFIWKRTQKKKEKFGLLFSDRVVICTISIWMNLLKDVSVFLFSPWRNDEEGAWYLQLNSRKKKEKKYFHVKVFCFVFFLFVFCFVVELGTILYREIIIIKNHVNSSRWLPMRASVGSFVSMRVEMIGVSFSFFPLWCNRERTNSEVCGKILVLKLFSKWLAASDAKEDVRLLCKWWPTRTSSSDEITLEKTSCDSHVWTAKQKGQTRESLGFFFSKFLFIYFSRWQANNGPPIHLSFVCASVGQTPLDTPKTRWNLCILRCKLRE